MTDAEKIKQTVELLHPFTTHEAHGDKKQQVINDAFEMLEWGHLTESDEEKK